AVQSFAGLGDGRTIERWLRIQRVLRPARLAGILAMRLSPSPVNPRLTGQAAAQPSRGLAEDVLTVLRERFLDNRATRGVMIGMGAVLLAALAVFLIVRLARRSRWVWLLAAQTIFLGLAGAGIYWAARMGGVRLEVRETVVAWPDTPWRMRRIGLDLNSCGVADVSISLAPRAPLCLALSDFEAPASGSAADIRALPLFTPGRAAPPGIAGPNSPMAYNEERAANAVLVERQETPGLSADLSVTTDTLAGAVRNDSSFTLVCGVLLVRRFDRALIARLPTPFPPGEQVELRPVARSSVFGASKSPPPAPAPRAGPSRYAANRSMANPVAPLVLLRDLACGESISLTRSDYDQGAFLVSRFLGDPTAGRILPNWGEIAKGGGIIVGWIADEPPLEGLLRMDPPPKRVLWTRPYVQLLR
ncbi:MAG: hypothetical protein NTW86_29155, partial [Candidatus Sumerlaeota bacterium]|nr:hypothetical protein [Candidatus Sumerlaeota bacterium]